MATPDFPGDDLEVLAGWGFVTTEKGTGLWLAFVGAALALTGCRESEAAGGVPPTAAAESPVGPAAAPSVTFAINTADRHPISRFIYGMNVAEQGGSPRGASPWYGAVLPAGVTLNRFGGNRLSAFNWETGASNVGSDGHFSNDAYLVRNGASYNYGSGVGAAVAGRVQASMARGQGIIVTLPMTGFVAGTQSGTALATTDAGRTGRLTAHFKVSRPAKGAALSVQPDTADGAVYQDEFAHWLDRSFPGAVSHATTPVFFSLDNEPDLWYLTHKEIFSDSADDPGRPRLSSYAGFADLTVAYAAAIKAVVPSAVIFGPAVATYTGIVSGGRYANSRWYDDPQYGRQNFVDVYLARMKAAEVTAGKRLLDVLDVHYYTAATTGTARVVDDFAVQSDSMIGARLQSTRSLWDPTYTEGSWVNRVTNAPIQLIPRLRAQVDAQYPGTRLAISEYYFGRAGDISGGLAQADALGIFGREGLFAATLWPQANVYAPPFAGDGAKAWAFAFGAFRLFTDYDGRGGRFGDTGVGAFTSDVAQTSVYASLDAAQRVVIVAINKSRTDASTAAITVADPRTLSRVAYVARMSPQAAVPAPLATTDVSRTAPNRFRCVLPALSATVIVLAP